MYNTTHKSAAKKPKSQSTQRERMPWRPDTSAPPKQSAFTGGGDDGDGGGGESGIGKHSNNHMRRGGPTYLRLLKSCPFQTIGWDQREARDWRVCDEFNAQSDYCERPSLMCILTRQTRRGYAENATKRKMEMRWWGPIIKRGWLSPVFLSGCDRVTGCMVTKGGAVQAGHAAAAAAADSRSSASRETVAPFRTVISAGLRKLGFSGG